MQHFKHPFKNFILTTPVAILLGSVIIALGLVGYGLVSNNGTATVKTIFAGPEINESDFIEGNIKSDVIVMEYSDPECPYCIQFHPTMKQIRTDYASKITFVYRHFPLTTIHPHAFIESKAIVCAGIVGGKDTFYSYIDGLYGYKVPKQDTNNFSPQLPVTGKEDIASGVGLDKAAFTACMNDVAADNIVNTSQEGGASAGVEGTPSTFVLLKTRKGYEVITMIDGARPYNYVKAAIDEALSR